MEIEVKVPIRDRMAVLERVLGLGATLVSERDQEDVYFAHPVRDFGVTDEALRLRKDGQKEVLTYKGPKLDERSKTREEVEFAVPYSEMRTVLDRLGFKESFKVRKHRAEYLLEGVSVCLDDVEGLGSFVELEFEGQDIEVGLERIGSLKRELGIEGNETRSYLELLYINKGIRNGQGPS
ncbi:MAG: class IV adenylate cyclase [Methanomassiliicoccales archaeon]|jgi:adenylate cyclase class 2